MMQFIKPWEKLKVSAGTTTKDFNSLYKKNEINKLLRIERSNVVYAKQIHNNDVAIVSKRVLESTIKRVDGLITKEKNICLVIKTADCIPVFYYDPFSKIIGIAHAGWRGSLKGISEKMVEKLISLGAILKEIRVHLGPHIKKECYEIDKSLALKFIKKFGKRDIISRINNKIYLDLAMVNYKQLINLGIRINNITISSQCTFCEDFLYYSYRRDYNKSFKFNEMSSYILRR